ncbi:nucleotidyltransferase domain-containing protein [Halorussus sp. MSC15.2]|uniref:nucleotidyltransferase domain-containing protein n=1 Tax=Halorussus sp. MSC15.2 TaxID=2283638 RepID=UPI0013D5C2E3|nr:nucleotidyltransferase domain-containing protein [Halorussus sp. MSC15.2]NEU56043.1 hypothetical protein [Halorussus sp. MSC15.2]
MAVELDIPPDVSDNLTPAAEDFLADVSESLNPRTVRAVMLYGSSVSERVTENSDVDVLVVLEPEVPDEVVDRARERHHRIENEHFTERSALGVFERWFQHQIGSVSNGNVCRADDVTRGSYHAIFGKSALSYLFVPWRTILKQKFDEGLFVYGDETTPEWDRVGRPSDRVHREMLRSYASTLSLAVLQFPLFLTATPNALYATMAYKKCVYNVSYYTGRTRFSDSFESILRPFPEVLDLHKRFLRQREEDANDLVFALLAPVGITVIHFWALWDLR